MIQKPTAQATPTRAKTCKVRRQPSQGSKGADRPLATTAPLDIPALMAALAVPRRSSGNQSTQALVKQGMSPPWAMPKINRDHHKPANEPAGAAGRVHADQTRP